jgi:hypothetical protein
MKSAMRQKGTGLKNMAGSIKKIKKKLAGLITKKNNFEQTGFSGLEVTTYLNGKKMTICAFSAFTLHNMEHQYVLPIRISENEILTGYSIGMHRSSIFLEKNKK